MESLPFFVACRPRGAGPRRSERSLASDSSALTIDLGNRGQAINPLSQACLQAAQYTEPYQLTYPKLDKPRIAL